MSEVPILDAETAAAVAKPAGETTLPSGIVLPAGVRAETAAAGPPKAEPVVAAPLEPIASEPHTSVDSTPTAPKSDDEATIEPAAEAVDAVLPEAAAADTPETSESLIARAHSLAERIVSKRTDLVLRLVEGPTKTKKPSELSPGDKALFDAVILGRGFSPARYSDNPDGIPLNEANGGIKTHTDDGTEVTVLRVKGPKQKNGILYYECITDPAYPTATTEVAADVLKQSHLATHAIEIGNAFSDPSENALAAWHAEGETGEAPAADKIDSVEATLAESEALENSPVGRRNRIIQESITRLHTEINDALEAGEKVPDEKRRFVAQLELAQALKGSQLENWANRAVLKSLDPAKVGDLTDLLDELAPGADAELNALEPQLKAAGVSTAEFNLLQEKGLGAILGNDILTAKFRKMENIDQILGDNMDQDKLISILDKNISPKDKALWDKMKGGGKLGGGLLLAILIGAIAVPAAALVAGAQVAGKRAA